MAPDVVLQGRDVQVAHQHAAPGRPGREPGRGLVHEGQLVGEFRVDFGVRHVATGGHVEVVQLDQLVRARHVQVDGQVPAVAFSAPIRRCGVDPHGVAGQDRDAVVALHAAPGDVGVP